MLGRRLDARSTTPARPSCTPTTTARWSSCAATSTSTAGCARRSATWSRSRARGVAGTTRRQVARRPALDGRARRGRRPGARAGRRARRVHHSGRQVFAGARLARRAASRRACSGAISLERRGDGAASADGPAWERGRCAPSARRRRRRCSTPVPGHGRARAPARGRGDPAVRARQRRPQLDLPARALARAHGPHLLDLGARPDAACHATERRRAAAADRGGVRAGAGAGLQGLRRLARRRRGGGHRLGDGLPAVLLPGCRARAYLVHDHEPEFFATSAERDLGRADLLARTSTRSRAAPGCATCCATATGATAPAFRFGVDHDVYRPRGASSAAATRCSSTRATRRRGARCRSGCSRSTSCGAGARTLRIVLVRAATSRSTPSFPYEHLGIVEPRGARAALLARRTVGLCLSLTNYSLIPQEMMACGLPCVDLAGGSPEAEFGARRPGRARRAGPARAGRRDRAAARRRGALAAALRGRARVRGRRDLGARRAPGRGGAARGAQGALASGGLLGRLAAAASARASISGTPSSAPGRSSQNVQAPTHPGRNRVARSKMSGNSDSSERSLLRKTIVRSVWRTRPPCFASLGSDAAAALP